MGQKFQDSTAVYNATWTSSTAQNQAVTAQGWGYSTAIITVQNTGSITGGVLTFEAYDGANWFPVSATELLSGANDGTYSLANGSIALASEMTGLSQFRARLSTAITGSGSVLVTLNLSAAAVSSIIKNPGAGTNSASTSNTGWSVSPQSALTNTAVAIKAGSGNLGGLHIYNPNAAVTYLQFFNVAQGSVTVGTTAPTFDLVVPPYGWIDEPPANPGTGFSTAITVAATTGYSNGTAPTTALQGTFWYI